MKLSIKSTAALISAVLLIGTACKKSTGSSVKPGGTYPVITDSTYSPTDPSLAATIGFFQNGWTARNFTKPDTIAGTVPSGDATDSLTIDVNKVLVKTSPYLFGNNSDLWMGQIVTQTDLMRYIKDLSPNIIRAPAGSVSDIYFFNGTSANPRPADAPDSVLDSDGKLTSIGQWYGNSDPTGSSLRLDNYYTMLAQANSTGIITIDYGYARYGIGPNPVAAAAHLAAD